jgi:hypothetical protein
MSTKLTRAQVIRAASWSTNPSVKKAYEKLQFTLSLAHPVEELEEMGEANTYHLRLCTKNGATYDNLVLRWNEEEMAIYAPRTSMVWTGAGNLLKDDPAIMYIKADNE